MDEKPSAVYQSKVHITYKHEASKLVAIVEPMSKKPLPEPKTEARPDSAMATIDCKETNRTDEFFCVEYAEEIFAYLMESEKRQCYTLRHNFLEHQVRITANNRRVLVDWLVKVHDKMRMVHDTLFVCVDVIDRYLQVERVDLKNLQLVGVTSMLIAAKYEEIYPPLVDDMVYTAADAYTGKQIRDMERSILQKLDYQLNKPHALHFLRRFSSLSNSSHEEHALAKYVLELALMQADMSSTVPSLKAAAALQLSKQISAKHGNTKPPKWPAILARHSSYHAPNLVSARCRLRESLCLGHNHPELTSSRIKFRNSRFCHVSEISTLNILTPK